MYIRATGNISPQHTFGDVPFLENITEHTGTALNCTEPDYKNYIDPKMIRRMSRIIRMGVAAASACLKEAGIQVPDAIITGTAYGCLQDTDTFLSKMVEQKEELLTPTAFIQSTHNTIGAQIGLMIKSNNYNNAFVHRGFSFESALLDGIMLLMENPVSNVLVGAIDEITVNSHEILKRFGLYKQAPVSNLELLKQSTKGTMAGEGAAFFLLANTASDNDYAQLNAMHTFYKPSGIKEIEDEINGFLSANQLSISDVDLVITGRNGDIQNDLVYDKLQQTIFNNSMSVNFKNLCGEYPTATAFALWMAAKVLHTGSLPALPDLQQQEAKMINRILIYNHYQQKHHSLLLVSAC